MCATALKEEEDEGPLDVLEVVAVEWDLACIRRRPGKKLRCLTVSTAVVLVQVTALGLSARTWILGTSQEEMTCAEREGQSDSRRRGWVVRVC